MKNWIKTILAVSVLCLSACSDDPDMGPLKRDTDAVELTYNTDATTRVSVRYAGSWSARVECVDENGTQVGSWFAISPSNGVGDGREYQWITVTAERNSGDKRTGYIYIKPANGQEMKVEVAQADGHFTVDAPKISGVLKSNSESTAMLEIKYDKAFGGETVEIMSSLGGDAAEGLSIVDKYETVIEREGSGTIVVPITGTPASLGKLLCHVTFKLNGDVAFQGDVEGSVSSSNEVFRMAFDLFVWGGDYPNNKKGPGPNGTAGANKDFNGTEPSEPDMITAGTDGTSDVFNTMGAEYRINRNVSDWSGLRVYEHPGYVKLGVTANGGWIMTPELGQLSAAPQTVVVSIDFLRFDGETGTYLVTAEGAGVVTNGEVNSTVLPAQTSAAGRKWTTLNFTVQDATNKTRIKIAAQTYNETGYRINIDNVVVMGAEQPAVTEKLPAPDLEKVTFTPADESIAFAWEGVKGATSYEVSLAQQNRPDYRKTIDTEDSSCEFTDLEPGFYIFTIRSLYAPNPEFNSDEVSKLVGTLGYVVAKLDAPEGLVYSDILPTGAKVAWGAVSGTGRYLVVVKTTEGSVQAFDKVVTAAECVVTGLTPGTDYVASVKALAGDGVTPNEFDSDEATITFTTSNPVPMTAPAARLYAKTHGYAVIEWEYSAEALAERAVSADDTLDFRLKDSSGTVIEERTITDNKAFAFARYKFYRFAFGGLTPGASYTMEMRRKASIGSALYVDSEWVSVPVTVDNAPSTAGYLLYADFENYPYGAQPQLCAYGLAIGSGITDHTTQMKFAVPGSKNTVYNPTAAWSNATFCAAYAPMFDAAELTNTAFNSNVSLAMGVVKFGGGSKPGCLTLPKLTDLTGATDIILEIDASPYYEPGSGANAGAMEYDQAAAEGIEFYVRVTGGTVTEADGATPGAGDVKLVNVTAADMGGVGAEALKKYINTTHTLKISGATAETRIMIHTDMTATANRRMWLDGVRIRTAN
ncbi:fibronectin type III domain-containing protein [uncultured Alistipes sp.]|uniref:fibronectin type III domain-containing protein n=1 Tax=uncultured Alistipes sp. TaxID=538949 RepID=UPI0025E7C4F7|nr:fibronectin type III domain-containing protein [uncultured Alistipes sp.]